MNKLHRLFRLLRHKLRDFARSEKGMTLPLMAVSMVAITGMAGLAIDTARAQLVQSKLQYSLDSAGLAAGSTVSTSSISSEVSTYLNVNFNGYLGATITGSDVSADGTNTVILLSATASVPTTFMNVLGLTHITVTANSQISRALTGLELVLVLDNTGSMNNSAGGSTSKIQALQSAATTLINSLFASNPPAGKLWVGIVPFSQAVNIGTSHPTWMNATFDASLTTLTPTIPNTTGTPPAVGWGTTSWAGCVDSRGSGEDTTDDPPVQNNVNTLFNQYYWPSDNLTYNSPLNNQSNAGYNPWARPVYKRCKNGSCTNNLSSCSQTNGYSCTVTGYSYPYTLNTTDHGPNNLCPQQVTMMTNVKSTLTGAINSMTAQGNTEINQGLEWGWNMLSPRWRGLWGGTMNANSLPLDYNSQGMQKVVVLLTDGENTIDNTSHGSYWFLHNNMLGTTNSSSAVTILNNRTLQLCTTMKNNGIYIYTIALGTDPSQNALSMLRSCATADNYYFDSPSTSQLASIFGSIGDSLSNLRVSR